MDKIKSYIPVIVIIIVAVILALGFSFYTNQTNSGSKTKIISSDEAGNKVIEFINKKLEGRAVANLISVLEENGVYKIKFKIEDQEIESYTTLNGKLLFWEGIDLSAQEEAIKEKGKTIGNFSVSDEEIYRENNKPIIYFFASKSCPHCAWEEPILDEVVTKFNNLISYHKNIDTANDREIFEKFNPDYTVPTIILGGKYFRVGSGEMQGKEKESQSLIALICKLTANQPEETCKEVQDLIEQISN